MDALPPDPRARLLAVALHYFDFAVADLARHQLMDVRTLPNFEPSPQAYEASIRTYGLMSQHLPITKQDDIDVYTALIAGLVSQQLANDPGGQRWRRLLPRVITMLADRPRPATHSVRKRARPWIHAQLNSTTRPPSSSPAPSTSGVSNSSVRSRPAIGAGPPTARTGTSARWPATCWACSRWPRPSGRTSVSNAPRCERAAIHWRRSPPFRSANGGLGRPPRSSSGSRFGRRKRSRGRRRVPAFLRGRRLPGNQRVNGADEPWTVGYLSDIILTRDPWMHRIDISRATGRPLHLTADHDGVIVADVVAEWSARHGKDFTLTLDGPAGGTWTVGANGPALQFETIEFCRCLSGRPGSISLDDLFATEVPY